MTGATLLHVSGGGFGDAIRAALGGAPDTIEPSRLHRFSTGRKRGDASGWCRLFADGRAGVFGCWRAGFTGVWTAANRESMSRGERAAVASQVAQARALRHREEAARWRRNADRMVAIWHECRPVEPGDPVHRYLVQRLALPGYMPPTAIRLHPGLTYWHGGESVGKWPAMVAPVVSPDGRTNALHQTYLTCDGRKADVPGTDKKVTPARGPLAGASIHLYLPDAAGNLGVAEGIETALAAHQASGVPTVAAYCAGALAGFQWPLPVRRLVVFADNDPVGLDAAERLQSRAIAARLKCEVLTPTSEGADWADVWAGRDEIAVPAEVAA